MINVDAAIKQAGVDGILLEMRAGMPTCGVWPSRSSSDILGICIHQNAGGSDPHVTAAYHTSQNNHITPGRPLPSICYHIAITDSDDPAWLVANPLWRTYAQGSPSPGDENLHLLSVVVMGNFDGPGHQGKQAAPTPRQMGALDAVVLWAQRVFSFTDSGMFGHYHFGKASCPGYAIQEWIEARRGAWAAMTHGLGSPLQWQLALLRWDFHCLPKYGADGDWGDESKAALSFFQRAHHLKVTAVRDPFTELVLLMRYPAR
jgi:hypothetical protein